MAAPVPNLTFPSKRLLTLVTDAAYSAEIEGVGAWISGTSAICPFVSPRIAEPKMMYRVAPMTPLAECDTISYELDKLNLKLAVSPITIKLFSSFPIPYFSRTPPTPPPDVDVTRTTLAMLRSDLRELLGDTSETGYSDPQCADAINEAIKYLCGVKSYTYREGAAYADLSLSPVTTYSPSEEPVTFNLIGSFPSVSVLDIIVGASYTVSYEGDTDWVSIGATGVGSPAVYLGETFTATAVGTGTGRANYNYDYTDYIKIKRVLRGGVSHNYYTADIHELTATSLDIVSMHNPDWRKDFGCPQSWCFWQGDSLLLLKSPYPSNVLGTTGDPSSYIITVGYVQTPLRLSADTDMVDVRIPPHVHPYIKYWAAAWLLHFDGTDSASLATAKTYQDIFNSLIED